MNAATVAYLLGQMLDGVPVPSGPDPALPPDRDELDEAARLYALCQLADEDEIDADEAVPFQPDTAGP